MNCHECQTTISPNNRVIGQCHIPFGNVVFVGECCENRKDLDDYDAIWEGDTDDVDPEYDYESNVMVNNGGQGYDFPVVIEHPALY